jgi:hypothetical protein
MLAAVSTGAFLARLAVTRYPLASAGHPSVRVWGWASVSLLAIYALQEFLEGLFAGGHPEGPLGIFGGGGWWAIPAAVAVAGVLALLLRGAHVLVNAVARRRRSVRRARPRRVGAPVPPVVEPVHVAPLARCAAGRAPPVAASAAL